MEIESKALKLVNSIIDKAIDGIPGFKNPNQIAVEYLEKYKDKDKAVDALIKWETTKNFSTGFFSGLGGIITLPVTVPSALLSSWIIQARMAAAIATIYGHDINHEQVKTFVILSIIGDSAKEPLKTVGIQIGEKITKNAIKNLSSKSLKAINKQIGFKLITKSSEKGVINLAKIIPFAGGIIGGSIDAISCKIVGEAAKNIFRD